MMRTISNIFFCLAACIFFSCKKVIDIKLKEADIKYVIEGMITNEPGSCKVYLTRSKHFNENNQFAGVSGALIKLKDNGNEYILTETAPGVYENAQLIGTPGHLYQLSVAINNENFTASCTMPQPVQMDTVYIAPGPFGQFKFATIGYTDPGGVDNGYRFVQYVNGVKDPTIFWENDEFTDGQLVIIQLDSGVDKKDDPRNIKTGDEVIIEMQSLDEAVYKYWFSLRTNGSNGEGNIATPANPVTNIQGGALGYFSAHTVDRRKLIAP